MTDEPVPSETTPTLEKRDAASTENVAPDAALSSSPVEDSKEDNLFEYLFSCIMPVLPISLESQNSLEILFSLKISS